MHKCLSHLDIFFAPPSSAGVADIDHSTRSPMPRRTTLGHRIETSSAGTVARLSWKRCITPATSIRAQD